MGGERFVGTLVAEGAGDQVAVTRGLKIEIWDPGSERLWSLLEEDSQGAGFPAWSPSGEQIAGSYWVCDVRIWDAASGQLRYAYEGLRGFGPAVAWAADGRRIAFAFDRAIELREVVSGRLRHTLEGHEDRVSTLAWEPSGGRIASAAADEHVRIWDSRSGRFLHQVQGFIFGIDSLQWDPRGERIAASADEGIRVWDAASGAVLTDIEGWEYWSLALAPDGGRIAAVSEFLTVAVWETAGGKRLCCRLARLYTAPPLTGIVVTQDGHAEGPREALAALRFADGWTLYGLEDVPQRHSPERVREVLAASGS